MFNKSKQNGFTLIELMVTTSIMILLLSVVIANFGSLGKQRNLDLARNNTISDIRRTQSLALASKDFGPGVPAGYYGISFDTQVPTQYTFITEDSAGNRQTSPTVVKLPSKVNLTGIRVTKASGAVVTPTSVEILFRVAFGRPYVSYVLGGSTVLKESDDVVRLTYTSLVDNTTTIIMDINGIAGNINQ